jgi:probable F420-dependent oxidoreductase
VKYGLAVTTSANPNFTPPDQADYIRRVAALAEELDFDSVWVADRTIIPADLAARYPESFGPGRLNPAAQNLLEALTVLTYLAGVTRRVRLGVGVLVLPFRNPVVTAKMITSLDVLSGGRVIFGAGAGWMAEEFEANQASLAERGPVTDEWLELFKALCTQEPASYAGRHYRVSDVVFFPKPTQQPHPPIWVGGNSPAALRRTARLGDSWHGIRLAPAEVAAGAAELRQWCGRVGRDPAQVGVSHHLTLALGQDRRTEAGGRAPLSGSPEQVLEDLRGYQAAGVHTLVMSVAAPDTETTLAHIRRFADLAARV